jgi:hypothetical protein
MTTPNTAAVWTAALGLALAAAPAAPAQDVDLNRLKTTTEEIRDDLAALKAVITGNSAAGMKDGVIDRLKTLDEQVRRLELRLAQIDDKLSQMVTRTAGSSPVTSGTNSSIPQPMAGPSSPGAGPKGFVRLVNEYSVEVSLLLNGRAHRLTPGETRTVEVPSGDYTYELLQASTPSQPVTSKIKDGETITLRIH